MKNAHPSMKPEVRAAVEGDAIPTQDHAAVQFAQGVELRRDVLPLAPAGAPLTMSSREIAELTGKEHRNVLADIRKMLAELGLYCAEFSAQYQDSTGRSLPCFNLPKRETHILMMGYSVEMRARVYDRWQELEEHQRQPALPTLPNFTSPAEAARAWALQFERAEQEQQRAAVLERQVDELAPKAQFHDAVTGAANDQTVREVAKVLGTGQNRLFAFLRGQGLLMRNNLPYQRYVDAGHFRVVEQVFEDRRGVIHTYTRTLVTGKGLALIQRRLAEATARPIGSAGKARHRPAIGLHRA